jgi:dolichyl-phosphate-mannose-protein mannosyltransferase
MIAMTAPPLVDEAVPAPKYDDGALDRIRAKLVRPLPSDRLMGWLLPLAITVLGGIARFWRITRPGGHSLTNKDQLVFDEVYYAHDSWGLLHHGVETSGDDKGAGFVVHPPLGKWMMAVGEAIFDHGKQFVVVSHSGGVVSRTYYPANPFSFRFAGAVCGTLAILMVARIARRMFHSTGLGVIAGALVALDGLEFVQSRTAMLDIFLMFWVLAAFACLVIDRDDGRRRLASRLTGPLDPDRWGPSLGFRPWRWGTGICLGAACATKWDGAYYIPAFLLLAIAWDVGARRTAGVKRNGLWRGAIATGGPAVAAFVIVPAVVYVGSWTGWFLSNGRYAYYHDYYVRPGQSWFQHDWAVWRGWLHYQNQIWFYDKTLDKPHPYLSKPWGWLLLTRPVAYYYQSPKGCGTSSCSQEVLGIGNPALWWATIPALIAVAWAWVARRDWRAPAILVTFMFGYLPWVFEEIHTVPNCSPAAHCHRTMFLFYLLPDVPFMALAVTMAIGLALGQQAGSAVRQVVSVSAVALYLAAVVVIFGFFYPVLAARNIPYDQWHDRMWLHNCQSKPDTYQENAPCWI